MDLAPNAKSYSVAYLGPEATFSHQAAIGLFGKAADMKPGRDINEVFELVALDECTNGVVPIENSYEGSITVTLDLFYEYELKITAESFIPVRHQLLSNEDRVKDIKKIYSHPMAIAQCRKWLRNNMPEVEIEEVVSTSNAADISTRVSGSAAIGSRLLSKAYDLSILKENIEDNPHNITRFLVIGKKGGNPTGKDKTSIIFSLLHRPGSLHKALGALAKAGINMTSIQSRPIRIKNWEYIFFMDLEGHQKEDNMGSALKEMEQDCVFLKRLGSYPAGDNY